METSALPGVLLSRVHREKIFLDVVGLVGMARDPMSSPTSPIVAGGVVVPPVVTTTTITRDPNTMPPEWLRVPDAMRIFGITRSILYLWIADGRIRSTCLHQPGAKRGIRLLSYASLASYIEQAARNGGELPC